MANWLKFPRRRRCVLQSRRMERRPLLQSSPPSSSSSWRTRTCHTQSLCGGVMLGRHAIDYDDEWDRGNDLLCAMSRCCFGRHGVSVAAVEEAPTFGTTKSSRD